MLPFPVIPLWMTCGKKTPPKVFKEFAIDTICCFFHSFLYGSFVVEKQTLPKVWMNQLE